MYTYSITRSNQTGAFLRLVDSIKRAKENGRDFTIFIGAGCSMTSSIHNISTEQIIMSCLKDHFDSTYEHPGMWESLYKDFVNEVWGPNGVQERLEILSKYFINAEPSSGYLNLRRLVEQGYITGIVTTNFDMLLNKALDGLSYNLKVGSLPVRKVKGGSNIHLLKVHGDIESDELRFDPDQLDTLPEEIQSEINRLSKQSCLFCGQSGQDRGLMKSLHRNPDFAVFWASPKMPIKNNMYETHYIYNWIESRKSEANFIFGDDLGKFDSLMEKLADAIINDVTYSDTPSVWGSSTISQAISLNQRVYQIFTSLLKCSATLRNKYTWICKHPFYSKSYEITLNAYLFFYRKSDELPLSILQVPENEIEALLMGLAIEIQASTSGLELSPSNYTEMLHMSFEATNPHYTPDESFWNALNDVISAMQGDSKLSEGENNYDITLRMNSNGRMTMSVRDPKLNHLVDTVSLLSICGLFIPTCENSPQIDRLGKCKLLLQKHGSTYNISQGKLIFKVSNISKQELNDIYRSFFDNQSHYTLDAAGKIQGPSLEIIAELIEKESDASIDTISSFITNMAARNTRAFLKLRSAFEIDSEEYVSGPLCNEIDSFIKSNKFGMFIVGASGSGKTKAIQQFVKSNSDNQIIVAATAPKCGFFDNRLGFAVFWKDIEAANTTLSTETLININKLLEAKHQTLVLIIDGLNEIDGGLKKCAEHYREIIDFVDLIDEHDMTSIKAIITCRDFAFLDYCEQTGLYPSVDSCYCNFDGKKATPYYQIVPLTLEQQILFAEIYCENPAAKDVFLLDLKHNKYIQESFNQPYLMAVAAKYYSANKEYGANTTLQNIFSFFAQQMLKRLGNQSTIAMAHKVIKIYFNFIVFADSFGRKVTPFVLINQFSDQSERDFASQVLRQLFDINLFSEMEDNDYLRFSHDRIEEHFLCDYLISTASNPLVMSHAIEFAKQDTVFYTGIQSYFNRCMEKHYYSQILNQCEHWYNINPAQLPYLLISSLHNLSETDCIKLFQTTQKTSVSIYDFCTLILSGMKMAIQRNDVDYPEQFFRYFERLSEIFPVIESQKSYLYYIASRYYLLERNDYKMAGEFCDKASNLKAKYKNLSPLIEFQKAVLLKHQAKLEQAVDKLSVVYQDFVTSKEWECAAECALEWGSALRQMTKFEEALEVYKQVDTITLNDHPSLQAQIHRKSGTIYKNLMQQIVKDLAHSSAEAEEQTIVALNYYKKAMEEYDLAKGYMQKTNDRIETIKILSEQTEAALKIMPIQADQRYKAELYLDEEARLLSYFPIPDAKLVHMRLEAKWVEMNGDLKTALMILQEARESADLGSHAYRVFEFDYHIGHLVERNKQHFSHTDCIMGIEALDRAIQFNLPSDNKYILSCWKTRTRLMDFIKQKDAL